jgi:hypothetical protein
VQAKRKRCRSLRLLEIPLSVEGFRQMTLMVVVATLLFAALHYILPTEHG